MKDFFGRFLLTLRNRHFLVIDIATFLVTPAIALGLATSSVQNLGAYGSALVTITLVFLCVKLAIFYLTGIYRLFWQYASIEELARIGVAGLTALLAQTLIFFAVLRPVVWAAADFPGSLPIIESLLALPVVAALRFSVRLAERLRWLGYGHGNAQRVLVVGAGEAGVMIVKEMQSNPHLRLHAVGFVDDDPQKQNARIRGVYVLGGPEHIPELVRETGARQVIIAKRRASGKQIREIVRICEQVGVQVKVMPGLSELLEGTVSVKQLRDVQIEDLLRREPVQTDTSALQGLIRGKRVLVTGGGGSIGSELCRQVMRHEPAQLIVLGHGENSVFLIEQELRKVMPRSCHLTTVIADIRFADRIRNVFAEYRPEIVFHAAAHKHVPLMELNQGEAITNNVLGTRNLLDAATAVDVDHFVMISSDKAVNPTNIMGACKRVGELLLHQAAKATGKSYVAVRFGNVLGSRGSVVLTFKEQIAKGGPITITHPDMTRYFMTIPEAVQLVLQSAAIGRGGEVFVLDMGQPMKIADLARDMIQLSGLEVGRDIDIVFSGIRPGEKLFEELFVKGENYQRTQHEKIFIAENASSFVPTDLDRLVAAVEQAAQYDDRVAILAALRALVPEYHSTEQTGGAVQAEAEPGSHGMAPGRILQVGA
ncbi:MAG: polysaccharide biosynthesis protein [Chloroflexi bacterium]|nr:MAG: polysaccharide biosynthesis protein [Chloroflexota bacterium]